MIRWVKALFGKYDHKWFNQAMKHLDYRVPHLIGGDFHVGGDYCDNSELLPMLEKWRRELTYEMVVKLKIWLNGDIFGLKEAPPHMVPYLLQLRADLKEIFRDHMIDGNHDTPKWDDGLMLWDNRYMIIMSPSGRNYAMEHGHLLLDELLNSTEWREYCDKPNGASKLKLAQVHFLDKLDFFKDIRPLPKGFIELASKRASELSEHIGIRIYGMIFNHFHPRKIRFYYHSYNGVEYEHIFNKAHALSEIYL